MVIPSRDNTTTRPAATMDETVLRLHSLLELSPLLDTFTEWAASSVHFGQMHYMNSGANLFKTITHSDTSCGSERTVVSLSEMGDFHFLRTTPFSQTELERLSHCLVMLEAPLKNALRYHLAMRQCDHLTQRLSLNERTCSSLTHIDLDEQQLALEKLITNSELQLAMKSDALAVYYQPKVDIKTGEVKGLEALLRWQHAEKGLLSPEQFIPLAEQNGLIPAITRWVLNTVLRQCAQWQQQGLLVPIAVNLSVLDLEDIALPDYLQQLLTAWEIPAEHLELEITETAAINDHQCSIETLNRLSSLGVAVAIDDFGVGHSSLHRLKHLPVNTIKIDKSFVMEKERGEHDHIFIDAITRMGHQMGMKVVAEGVDSPEGLQRLLASGCDMAQGYHISRPLSKEAVTGWLLRGTQPPTVLPMH